MNEAQIAQMNETTEFSEYTVSVQSDPSYYGAGVSREEAIAIASRLSGMISARFPGIVIGNRNDGPDQSVCDEIHDWIQNNWTAAL